MVAGDGRQVHLSRDDGTTGEAEMGNDGVGFEEEEEARKARKEETGTSSPFQLYPTLVLHKRRQAQSNYIVYQARHHASASALALLLIGQIVVASATVSASGDWQ